MIREVTGDILLSNASAIAHGVSPNDDYGSGLALSLREQWPAMVKDFRHYCQERHPKPGEAWAWGGPEGKRIISLFTQEAADGHRTSAHGRANTTWVNHSLRELRQMVQEEGWTSLALPRLATGVGGLDWDDVHPIIQRQLGDLGIPIYLYTTFRSGVAADESAPTA